MGRRSGCRRASGGSANAAVRESRGFRDGRDLLVKPSGVRGARSGLRPAEFA